MNFPKVSKNLIRNFIHYIYTDEEQQFDENLPNSYLAAYYFDAKDLQLRIEDKLIKQMNKDIVIPAIDVAVLVGNQNLL